VVSINIAEVEGGAVRSVRSVELVAGKGIVGDRYFDKDSRMPEQELTLVEAEQIERFNAEHGLDIEPSETRRNIVTRGVSLNELVGAEFTLGQTRIQGQELCNPCKYLAGLLLSRMTNPSLTDAEIVAGLTPRAGLRARIVTSGTVRAGDAVETVAPREK
jgi:MOSC domain-containing protein YiiM